MDDIFVIGLRADWLILVLWWAWGLIGVKRAARTEPAWKQGVFYWLPLIVACALLRPGGSTWGPRANRSCRIRRPCSARPSP